VNVTSLAHRCWQASPAEKERGGVALHRVASPWALESASSTVNATAFFSRTQESDYMLTPTSR